MQTRDQAFLGTEPVGRLLMRLAIPTVIAQLVNMLYNIVDRIYIGHIAGIGSLALTGVGVCMPIIMIVTAFAALVASGSAPRASIAMGRGDRDTAEKLLGGSFSLQIAISLTLTAVLLLFGHEFLLAFGASENTIEYADNYLNIYAFGTLFVELTLGMNAFITAQGFATTGMMTVLIGAVCNIVLDPILIFGLLGFPRMEVAGAAVATIVGQFVGAGLGLFLNLKKNPEVQIHLKDIRPHRATVADIYAIGIPSIIMQSIGSVMMFGMNKILISFTEAATAVFGAYFKLQSFIFMPCFGLNNAMVPIVSYNYGAQKFDRVRKTVRLTVFTAIGIMCVGCALFELIPETLLGMFSPTDEMLSIGRVALRIIGVHFPLAGFSIIAGSACQALGKPIYALINSVCRQIVVLLPAAYLLSLTGRLELVWLAFPIAEVVSVILNATFLRLTYRASLDRK